MKNIKTTFESFIFESENPSYGWRVGDLKNKPERLSKYRGGRGTGHFGTGFYFFGFEPPEHFNPNKRDVNKIDFNNYTLLKVPNFNLGIELHKHLKETVVLNLESFNDLYKELKIRYTLGIKFIPSFFGRENYIIEYINEDSIKWLKNKINLIKEDIFNNLKVKKEVYDYIDNIDEYKVDEDDVISTMDLSLDYKKIKDVISKTILLYLDDYNDKIIEDIKSLCKERIEESKTGQDILFKHLEEIINELDNTKGNKLEIFNEYAKSILSPLASTISKIESYNSDKNRNEKEILDIFMKKILKISRRVPTIKAHYDKTTIGTELIKTLGYEGIDVRGIKELDNYEYGSVIYDIKS